MPACLKACMKYCISQLPGALQYKGVTQQQPGFVAQMVNTPARCFIDIA